MGESILIKGNRIACVGSNNQVRSSMSSDCEVIDLRQSIVFPGFVDAHCHVKGLGQSQEILRLDNTTSFNDVVDMVQNQAKCQDIGSWILGRNWNQEKWDVSDMPVKASLDSSVKDNPVWVTRVDAHAGLANSKAINIAKGLISSNPNSIQPQVSERSLLTGMFIDEEMDFIRNALPKHTVEDVKRMILTAQDLLVRAGLTEVHDAGIGPIEYQAYLELESEKKLNIRIYAMQNRDFFDNFFKI